MDEADPRSLRRLASEVKSLKQAMDMTVSLSTEDSGKWSGFGNYFRVYDTLARKYVSLTGDASIPLYDLEKIPSWGSLLWPQAKSLFEQVYSDTLILGAKTSEFETTGMISRSEIHDLVAQNLRKVVFTKPEKEVEIQNGLESLLVGRGYKKGFDYERESGRVKFSGKEFVPDFVFPSYDLCLEVKLIKEGGGTSKCIEEMSADMPAYLTAYERVLFCVYDLGVIQDIDEFAGAFQRNAGVAVCVVKH